ncbi:hypothetical protein ECTP14_02354 [Escherichia coli O157 typing phage 14]|uniref:Phage protein n=1 Tax=Escherichia coli O157 typing phage 14 TaxID=1508676 RepID=A0A0F6TKA0_9CAUD|nr:hypothetical protein ECTP14_02354 [Escherichia coli O157 typing phage 14]
MGMPITVKELNERDAGGLWPARKIRCIRMKENLEHLEQQKRIEVGDIFEVFYSDRRNWETIQPSGLVLAKLDTGEVIVPGLDIVFEIIQEWDPDKIRYEELFGKGIIKPV